LKITVLYWGIISLFQHGTREENEDKLDGGRKEFLVNRTLGFWRSFNGSVRMTEESIMKFKLKMGGA